MDQGCASNFSSVKNFAGAKVQTHPSIPHRIDPANTFKMVAWPPSDLISWAHPGCQISGGPKSPYIYLNGHCQAVPEPEHAERVGAVNYAYYPVQGPPVMVPFYDAQGKGNRLDGVLS